MVNIEDLKHIVDVSQNSPELAIQLLRALKYKKWEAERIVYIFKGYKHIEDFERTESFDRLIVTRDVSDIDNVYYPHKLIVDIGFDIFITAYYLIDGKGYVTKHLIRKKEKVENPFQFLYIQPCFNI